MTVFSERSYKSAIRGKLEDMKKADSNSELWSHAALAQFCGVQKTYLSRVFNGEAHLSVDQLFLASDYLVLSEEEKHYVELLHAWERSEVPKRRRKLEEELQRVRKANVKAEKHIQSEQPTPAMQQNLESYYLDPNIQLVHMFLTVRTYAQNPASIAARINISEQYLKEILSTLQQLRLITYIKHELHVLKDNLHLTTDSNLVKPYQMLMRFKSFERLQNSKKEDQYGYSLFFSGDDNARAEIQARFLAFLKDVEKVVRPAPCERVYQLHFDLVSW